jgi:hypothetical protein
MLANNICCCVDTSLAGQMDTWNLGSYYGTHVIAKYHDPDAGSGDSGTDPVNP